ncbi:chemotaxis protein CheW [Fredinandcohnia sp. QZ13]|uniref:chemotaxis protein CheW n=1 Tax=Fredinandcohnia sp. QZ13 TaxID=3073144 RepID=UPI0028536211|nr:chemotaxis protein CheW [Fredinandcohnia sp. QZ13]MDR4889925.1 chemotaxis protein CheW [Fredinandcohnia sp. QZ13]
MEGQSKVIVFRLEDQEYGTDIQKIRSIERLQEVTRIPNVPEFIKGVINLRGEVTPIIDLKERLAMGQTVPTTETRILIVEISDIQLGVIVDAATDVIDLDLSLVDSATGVIHGINESYIEGVAKLEHRLLLLLNLDKVLNKEEINEVKETIEV